MRKRNKYCNVAECKKRWMELKGDKPVAQLTVRPDKIRIPITGVGHYSVQIEHSTSASGNFYYPACCAWGPEY